MSLRPDYEEDVSCNLEADCRHALGEMRVKGQMKPEPSNNSKDAE